MTDKQETILEEAARTIAGDRLDDYGAAEVSFNRIAKLWSAYLGIDVTAPDVAHLMILMKVSRSKNGYKRDSLVDIAGYAALGEQVKLEPPTEKVTLTMTEPHGQVTLPPFYTVTTNG